MAYGIRISVKFSTVNTVEGKERAMNYKEYSINSTVWVKLNAIGRAMWKQHH